MQKFINKKVISDTDYQELKVREYMNRYVKELQRHFDLPDSVMRSILYKVYKDLSPLNFIKVFIKNMLCVIKSNCIKFTVFRRK